MKIKVFYTKKFIKQVSKLEKNLQKDVYGKVSEFQNSNNHKRLEVHKLKNDLKKFYSFSVNYKIRIRFIFEKDRKSATLLQVGDRGIYK